jgi:hypothetical protein
MKWNEMEWNEMEWNGIIRPSVWYYLRNLGLDWNGINAQFQ